MVAEDGRELEVHSYLIVFLKFVQVSYTLRVMTSFVLFELYLYPTVSGAYHRV